MLSPKTPPKNIDEYIASFPEDIQALLEKVRATIRDAAPAAEEAIKYQMPTFTLQGNLVHFAAHKKHLGFYPVPTGVERFKEALSDYEGGKGSVKFPYDKPIPFDIISEVVKFRVKENMTLLQKADDGDVPHIFRREHLHGSFFSGVKYRKSRSQNEKESQSPLKLILLQR